MLLRSLPASLSLPLEANFRLARPRLDLKKRAAATATATFPPLYLLQPLVLILLLIC